MLQDKPNMFCDSDDEVEVKEEVVSDNESDSLPLIPPIGDKGSKLTNDIGLDRASDNTEKKIKKSPKPGIIYLSKIPPKMNVKRVRDYFTQFGDLNRSFLQPDSKWYYLPSLQIYLNNPPRLSCNTIVLLKVKIVIFRWL